MLISPLQKYEPKDFGGLVTDNHLGALFAQEPQYISKVIEQLFRVNLGGDDVVSFLDQFPVEYIDDDRPFKWMLQGADEKNYPLTDAWKALDDDSAPSDAGLGFSTFVLI